jgi:hypothetical protein
MFDVCDQAKGVWLSFNSELRDPEESTPKTFMISSFTITSRKKTCY